MRNAHRPARTGARPPIQTTLGGIGHGPRVSTQRRQIRSAADIRRAMILLTGISVLLSVALSAVFVLIRIDFDLDSMVSARDVFYDTLIVSALLPAMICPLVVHRLLNTVRELNRVRAELHAISRRDPLTGLLNRRGFDEACEALQQGAAPRNTMAVLLCDIDHFKRVNDEHGHDCGDRALRHVASILQGIAETDPRLVAGRQGGEEFAVAGFGLGLREVAAIAENIRRTCAATPLVEGGTAIPLTLSIGTAIGIRDDESLRDIILRADAALYRAKTNGRDRVEKAQPMLAESA